VRTWGTEGRPFAFRKGCRVRFLEEIENKGRGVVGVSKKTKSKREKKSNQNWLGRELLKGGGKNKHRHPRNIEKKEDLGPKKQRL